MDVKFNQPRAFTLMELLVVMAVLSLLLTGISMIFVETSRVARVQTEQATMQQSQRAVHQEISKYLRMSGIGGLPITWTRAKAGFVPDYETEGSFPNGFAIAITNNSEKDARMPEDDQDDGDGGEEEDDERDWVLPGSDVLTVRGVFTTPVYYLLEPVELESHIDTNEIPSLVLQVPSRVGRSNFEIPLDPLIDRITEVMADDDDEKTIPFILRDLTNPDAYFIMALDRDDDKTKLTPYDCLAASTPASWPAEEESIDGTTWCIDVGLTFLKSGKYTKEWGNLSMGTNLEDNTGSLRLEMPTDSTKNFLEIPRQIGSIGILEEFRFYVKADWEIPGETASRLSPILARAEFLPGTSELQSTVDIARDVIDFQVAVGIENDSEVGSSGFNEIVDNGDENDEVLFNSPDDVLVEPQVLKTAGLDPPEYYNPDLDFHFIRLTTVAQLSSPTTGQWVPRLSFIEDHDLSKSQEVNGEKYNFNSDRNVPHSYLQTVIEMRNLR